MKNKYIIIGIVLIIFLGLNYNNFINFYYNSFGNYINTTNLVGKYNIGTSNYIDANYENSINSFSGVLDSNNKELNFRILYNFANSYYKFGEDKELNQKIELFTKSVENYREALNIKFDEQTQKNLEFVLEKLRITKLEKEKEKQENQEEDGEKNDDNGEDKKDEGEDKSSGENGGEKSDELGEKGEDQEGGDNNEGKLSEETKKILEEKEEELQKLQEEIGQYYNKNYKEKLDPFSNFNQFFDNDLLDENEEKDW